MQTNMHMYTCPQTESIMNTEIMFLSWPSGERCEGGAWGKGSLRKACPRRWGSLPRKKKSRQGQERPRNQEEAKGCQKEQRGTANNGEERAGEAKRRPREIGQERPGLAKASAKGRCSPLGKKPIPDGTLLGTAGSWGCAEAEWGSRRAAQAPKAHPGEDTPLHGDHPGEECPTGITLGRKGPRERPQGGKVLPRGSLRAEKCHTEPDLEERRIHGDVSG